MSRWTCAASLLCLAASLGLAPPGMAQDVGTRGGDHQAALAALTDVKAAIGILVEADASYATDRTVYHRASQRAINALEGTHGADYRADAGVPADPQGAIGQIDALLNRKETPVWAPPLHGAEANVRAAVAYLHDALRARELMDYAKSASRALGYLEVARGRSTDTGVLAGLEGALATTELGIPGDGQVVDACADPPASPAFGVRDGYLAWVTVPASEGDHKLPENLGGTDLTVRSGVIVVHTAAAPLVAKRCTASPAKPTPAAVSVEQHAMAAPVSGTRPKLYTEAQAHAGKQIFANKCMSCHGADLQGVAAPSVAGSDFLTTAEHNGWTLQVIRYLVFTMMPLNAAKSLSPDAYASVMAYLLASNCYPPGDKPFPTVAEPSFKSIKLAPPSGPTPTPRNAKGVCSVN